MCSESDGNNCQDSDANKLKRLCFLILLVAALGTDPLIGIASLSLSLPVSLSLSLFLLCTRRSEYVKHVHTISETSLVTDPRTLLYTLHSITLWTTGSWPDSWGLGRHC